MQSLVSGLFASRILFAAADGTAQSGMSPPEPVKAKGGGVVTVVKVGDIVPPRVAPPCKPGSCLFAGQSVTVIVSDSVISSSILEGKKEFEAATGARLDINRVPFSENFEDFFSDPGRIAQHKPRGKSQVYAARGWDGIDPGRTFHFLPPDGT